MVMAFPPNGVAGPYHYPCEAPEDTRRPAMTPYRWLFCPLPQSLFSSTIDMLKWWTDSDLGCGNVQLLYLFKDFSLDTDRRELRRGPQLVSMAPQVFDLLEYLIRNRERVVSKDDLFASIWDGRIVSESALSTRINAARCAIDDTGEEQRLIRTLSRKGVRFTGGAKAR